MNLSGLRAYYYDSEKILKDDIIWGLLELGVEVERPECIVTLDAYTEEQYQELEKSLGDTDFVITQNFSVMVAELCHQKGLPYISWIYDSPQAALYREAVFYPTNFIFVFDKMQLKRLQEIGVKQVYYQPLAANLAQTSILNISDEDIAHYASDVSFVGLLYKRDYYQDFLERLEPKIRDRYLATIDALSCNWGKGKTVLGQLDDEIRPEIEKFVAKEDAYRMDHSYLTDTLLVAVTVAQKERLSVLRRMAEKFNTRLYTYDPVEEGELPGVDIRPRVSYNDEMYKVFFSSKINLNLTMRAIETGVPLRVFDIMSVGGFVMSNYQEEMEELFVPDKEIVLFSNLEEMMEKAEYYLTHETERLKIAIAGYQRVCKDYNYPSSLRKMLETALQ